MRTGIPHPGTWDGTIPHASATRRTWHSLKKKTFPIYRPVFTTRSMTRSFRATPQERAETCSGRTSYRPAGSLPANPNPRTSPKRVDATARASSPAILTPVTAQMCPRCACPLFNASRPGTDRVRPHPAAEAQLLPGALLVRSASADGGSDHKLHPDRDHLRNLPVPVHQGHYCWCAETAGLALRLPDVEGAGPGLAFVYLNDAEEVRLLVAVVELEIERVLHLLGRASRFTTLASTS